MQSTPINENTLRNILVEQNLDALVLMSPENFAFGTGLHIFTIEKIRQRQAFMIVPRDQPVELILCSIEVPLSRATGVYQNIQSYVEFEELPVDTLSRRLKDLSLDAARIGIDADYMPVETFNRLTGNLGRAQFSDTSEAVGKLRSVKHGHEVSIIESAAKRTHQSVLDGMAASRLGDSEEQMCLRISSGILASGADGISFLVFASGERTMVPHAKATPRVPASGEIIRLDVGGTYGSYSSDFARTYSTGSPSELQRKTYAGLARIQRAVIAGMRPGITAEDVYFLARDEFRRDGMDFKSAHVGHGFGVELHETPILRAGDKTKLLPGMVINVEPVATDGVGSRYHIEDLVVITEVGSRLLTLGFAPENLPVIGDRIDYRD